MTESKAKGCGRKFMWNEYLNDERVCGQIEDLKHSDHIILCPECKKGNYKVKGDKKPEQDCPTKEKAWEHYKELHPFSSIGTKIAFDEALDIVLQEQAKEIRVGLELEGNEALSKKGDKVNYFQFRISLKKWNEFWQKYTGKEEGKDGKQSKRKGIH